MAIGTDGNIGKDPNSSTSQDINSPDIDGGTIDSATIGATTAGTLRALFDPDVVLSGTLTANQCSGGVITNYGQTAADTTVLLPTAFEGGNFLVVLGTAQAANDYILDLATGTEVMYLDGVALGAGKSIYIAAPTIGAAIQFVAQQTGESSYQWFAYTVSGAWVGES